MWNNHWLLVSILLIPGLMSQRCDAKWPAQQGLEKLLLDFPESGRFHDRWTTEGLSRENGQFVLEEVGERDFEFSASALRTLRTWVKMDVAPPVQDQSESLFDKGLMIFTHWEGVERPGFKQADAIKFFPTSANSGTLLRADASRLFASSMSFVGVTGFVGQMPLREYVRLASSRTDARYADGMLSRLVTPHGNLELYVNEKLGKVERVVYHFDSQVHVSLFNLPQYPSEPPNPPQDPQIVDSDFVMNSFTADGFEYEWSYTRIEKGKNGDRIFKSRTLGVVSEMKTPWKVPEHLQFPPKDGAPVGLDDEKHVLAEFRDGAIVRTYDRGKIAEVYTRPSPARSSRWLWALVTAGICLGLSISVFALIRKK